MLRREGLVHTPQQLAYLGDAVWSLHVRCKYLSPPKNFAAYRTAAERHVSAARQSSYLDLLLASGWRLRPEESRLVRWAQREMSDPRFRPKYSAAGGQLGAYRKATAFEALIGHLSLEDQPRLQQLLELLEPHMAKHDEQTDSSRQ
ncbi:hypothetical protein VOLCADRAFT_104675 [Volvox carteri f. nagariensis]|uniref:RNase III domain-containing protein n=1 Tax=Volvox carteri f. nagariensis TaxID=3068 RepID=D8TVP3_VOLCA|nr:uncharacterized protein VOLCADRAFT_104675 [Volvox carteri f. nagariensis]EFJ48488.1 hypothetical protein VOLCADRAFT_104675 [Volvox carteri f. nagariensis]|eukprot:XP_002950287.1 hypothetical protein VOLCADRAFT_104675 [Volvox carteri f. nagariensis]